MRSKFFEKMTSTKIAGLSLTMMLILTACGSKQTSNADTVKSASKPITLNIFLAKMTLNSQAQETLMNKFISDFEQQNPDIKIKLAYYESASQENSTLQTSLATKQGPDLFEIGTTFVPTAYATNGFHILTDQEWNDLGGLKKFFPAQLKISGPSPDKYIAIPEITLPYALLYNKKMFREAGITSPPKTWNEFVEDGMKLTHPEKDQWGTAIDPSDSFDPWHIVWVLTKQNGGDWVSSDLKKATIDSKQSQEALNFWFDWITKYKIASPADLTYKASDVAKAFENAHAAMLVMQGASLIPSLDKSIVKDDYEFAPMPTIPFGMTYLPEGGIPIQTFVTGQDICIPSYVQGDRLKAVLKWVKFVTDVPQQRGFFQAYGYLPVNLDAYKNYDQLNTPNMKAYVEAENNAYPSPFTGAWGNIEVIYGGVSSKIANEIATKSFKAEDIDASLKAANAQAQAALQQ